MKKRLFFFSVVGIILVILAFILLNGQNIAVLNPQGVIAERQRDLIVFTVVLSALVVIPVFVLLFFISMKYRATNTKAKYTPEWEGNKLLETIWWGIPLVIILVLSVVAWKSSHELDPSRALASSVQPVAIEVVALQWKWLFIYPDEQIASVNYLQIPEKTPINFKLTSDAPINSFWIPALGGQIYAMSGMSTKLSLMANGKGSYDGRSANISGEGFSKMKFVTKSTSTADFKAWVKQLQQSPQKLTLNEYSKLAAPNVIPQPVYYSLQYPNLYDKIIEKYTEPSRGATRGGM